MTTWLRRLRCRRWMHRYALAVVRHSGIGWHDALAMARDVATLSPNLVRCVHPLDAALSDLGILEADLI